MKQPFISVAVICITLFVGLFGLFRFGVLSTNLEFNIEGTSAYLLYDPAKWVEGKNQGKTIIQYRNVNKVALIGSGRIPSNKDAETYKNDFIAFCKRESYDGKCLEESINGNPILTMTQDRGGVKIVHSTLVVPDGPGYYETVFSCHYDLYSHLKEEAFEVLKTFGIRFRSIDRVATDPEMLKWLKKANEKSGIDRQAVNANISISGKELFGKWGYLNENGDLQLILALNPDYSFEWYKDANDSKNVKLGDWEYQADRQLILHSKKVIINGTEVGINKVGNTLSVMEIGNWEETNKEVKMFIRNLKTLNQYHFWRKK